MKSKLLLIVCILSSIAVSAQYSWEALPTAPKSTRFDDFYFVSADTGWVINPNYEFVTTAPLPGRIFRTYDGGATWQIVKNGSNTYYRSIGFADALTGWVGNLADTALRYGTYRYTTDTVPLYQTTDAGITWNPVTLPQPHPLGICGISVVSDSIIYAYGRYSGPAAYLKTIDKGISWISVNLDSLAFGLIDGHFFNKDTGFITAMGADHKAAILYTDNGGLSWRYSYHSTRTDSDRVWKIFFPSRNIGYASIEYGGSSAFWNGFFLKTTDGGNTWTEHPFIASYNEEGIGFVNDSVGWIGGDAVRGTYITTDGGDTWNDDESFGLATPPYTNGTAGFRMNRFRMVGNNVMYATGNTVYKLDALTTGVSILSAASQSLKNFPNPFEKETTISYSLFVVADNLQLEVYNVLGELVYRENLGTQNKGTHQVLFNKPLLPGTYYYLIKSNSVNLTNKMVIVG